MFDPEPRTFLDANMWAVLATSRRDGSPQLSLVGYVADDQGRITISTKSYTAKWRNILRQPEVSLAVVEGRVQLVVYGLAEAIDQDPERAELSADVFSRLSGVERPDPSSIVATLDEQQRTVIRVSPSKVVFHV